MRTIALLLLVPAFFYSQDPLNINFENGDWLGKLWIDTANTQNCWQIGTAEKPSFTTFPFSPNAIVTDTADHYPADNHSSFYIPYDLFFSYPIISGSHILELSFSYEIDADSTKDYGAVLISLDGGVTWVDYFNFPSAEFYWISPNGSWNSSSPPPFTGKSNGWIYCYSLIWGLINDNPDLDSITFRFDFQSDSIETEQDGWMIDEITILEGLESVIDVNAPKIKSRFFPNPGTDEMTLNIESPHGSSYFLEIFNRADGKLHLQRTVAGGQTSLSLGKLPPGAYVYHLKNEKGEIDSAGQVVIIR
ncbi:MAG: T9SS type A sorting domain-containing protein [Saprospiraceae bacterium]